MQHPGFAAAARAVVAVGGGYALIALAVSALAALLARAGQAPSDAVVTAAMLGFPAYLCLLLWALACLRLARLTGVLGLGCLVFGVLAWLGARA
ncbi:MAG: iron transporter [Comamonas sp.]